MTDQVLFARDAERDTHALHSSVVPRVFKAIKALGQNPRPPGCKKLKGVQADPGAFVSVRTASSMS